MAGEDELQQSIRRATERRYKTCPELYNLMARESHKLKIPIIAEMLQALPCEAQKDIITRFGDHIYQIDKMMFNEVAAEWFSSETPFEIHSRYAIIYELKSLLRRWGFLDFYDKHKLTLRVNMIGELFNHLNIYFCLDELCETSMNKVHDTPSHKLPDMCGITNSVGDPKLSMIEAAEKTFFMSAMLNLQLKWMFELIDLSYMDGSMRASLDSAERELFEKMNETMKFSNVDEVMDAIEMFPTHASKETTAALRVLLKNADNEIRQMANDEKRRLAAKR